MGFELTVDRLLLTMMVLEWWRLRIVAHVYALEVVHNLPRSEGNPDRARGSMERAGMKAGRYGLLVAMAGALLWRQF